MSKKLKRVLGVFLAIAVLAGLAVFASSEPDVFYNGTTEQIEFGNALPFGRNTAPDLFVNLKNLMPGDSVTEEIQVGAVNVGAETVEFHLRATNYNADYERLMSDAYAQWVTFTVEHDGETLTGDLANGVELGSYGNGDTSTLVVTVAIEPEAGNELQGMLAEIEWVFVAEVIPTVGPILPEPGDNAPHLTDEHVNYIIGYPDGTVRPDNAMNRAEFATIFYRLLIDELRTEYQTNTNPYSDVGRNEWYSTAISTLTSCGYLQGDPDGEFRPEDFLTRAELATMLCRFDVAFGQVSSTLSFPDIEGHWAEEYIKYTATRGYNFGYPDGLYNPDRPVTRAEAVTMLNRLLQRAVDEEGLPESYTDWVDNDPNAWYHYDMLEAGDYHTWTRSDRQVPAQAYYYEDWLVQLPVKQW